MQLQKAIGNVFVQLSESIHQLSDEQYKQPSNILFNATIGQHVRHIIELFICLNQGYETGVINYEKRKRDYRIETERELAIELLHSIYTTINKPDKNIMLEVSYDEHSNDTIVIHTNYYREIAYNLEHTVHHMALIRVGINEVSAIELPSGYGVASSTIKYRQTCAQ
jgi:hypothetical protein